MTLYGAFWRYLKRNFIIFLSPGFIYAHCIAFFRI